MINKLKLNKVKQEIVKQFPEFKGVKPLITEKVIAPQDTVFKKLSLGAPKEFKRVFRLQFKKRIETADRVALERILTVSLDEQGKIIKITESR